MTYDAVSAYTVLFGDGDGPVRVTVHGSAEDAWLALDRLVRPGHARRRTGWRTHRADEQAAVDPGVVHDAAERWRRVDPGRRCWHVAPHRLQVTVPAIAR